MTDDLVRELRALEAPMHRDGWATQPIRRAADEIERLTAEYRRASGLAAELALRAAACDDWRARALAAEAKIAAALSLYHCWDGEKDAAYVLDDVQRALRDPAEPAAEQ